MTPLVSEIGTPNHEAISEPEFSPINISGISEISDSTSSEKRLVKGCLFEFRGAVKPKTKDTVLNLEELFELLQQDCGNLVVFSGRDEGYRHFKERL